MKMKLMFVAVAMAVVLTASSASAALMSASLTAPVVDGLDIANYNSTHLDKWFYYTGEWASRVAGQTFTTGSEGSLLNAITYQIADSQYTDPDKTYTIRVSTVNRVDPGDDTTWVLTEIHSEGATQDFTWNNSEFMTWTLDSPLLLAADTEYGIDVGMNSSTVGWQQGIPYLQYSSADEYAGGTRYWSGPQRPGDSSPGGIGDTTMQNVSGERVFHLDMVVPEPATIGLLALGGLGALVRHRRG